MSRAARVHYVLVRTPKPLPSPFGDGPFRVSDARAADVTGAQLRGVHLDAPFAGTRVAQRPTTTIELCAVYAVKMRPEQFFSHLTAAELYGFPLPYALQNAGPIHVSVVAPAHAPKAKGVIGHRLTAAGAPLEKRGLRALPPAETWAQLGIALNHEQLVMAGDFLVRRKYPLCTMPMLMAVVAAANGVPGIRAVRAALVDVRPKTDSPQETRLRLLIVNAGLPEPVIGHQVIDADGYFVAVPDLCYVSERIAIEYEGDVHRTDAATYADDIRRRERLEDAGWLVIRVIKDHLNTRPDLLIARIAQALAARS